MKSLRTRNRCQYPESSRRDLPPDISVGPIWTILYMLERVRGPGMAYPCGPKKYFDALERKNDPAAWARTIWPHVGPHSKDVFVKRVHGHQSWARFATSLGPWTFQPKHPVHSADIWGRRSRWEQIGPFWDKSAHTPLGPYFTSAHMFKVCADPVGRCSILPTTAHHLYHHRHPSHHLYHRRHPSHHRRHRHHPSHRHRHRHHRRQS